MLTYISILVTMPAWTLMVLTKGVFRRSGGNQWLHCYHCDEPFKPGDKVVRHHRKSHNRYCSPECYDQLLVT